MQVCRTSVVDFVDIEPLRYNMVLIFLKSIWNMYFFAAVSNAGHCSHPTYCQGVGAIKAHVQRSIRIYSHKRQGVDALINSFQLAAITINIDGCDRQAGQYGICQGAGFFKSDLPVEVRGIVSARCYIRLPGIVIPCVVLSIWLKTSATYEIPDLNGGVNTGSHITELIDGANPSATPADERGVGKKP